MMVGVVLFSFALGQVGELLSSMDKRYSNKVHRMKTFSEMAEKIKLPKY